MHAAGRALTCHAPSSQYWRVSTLMPLVHCLLSDGVVSNAEICKGWNTGSGERSYQT